MAASIRAKNQLIITELMGQLRQKVERLRNYVVTEELQRLEKDNAELEKQCEEWKTKLAMAETRNGKKQYPLPGKLSCAQTMSTDDKPSNAKSEEKLSQKIETAPKENKKDAKKNAQKKPAGEGEAKPKTVPPKVDDTVCVSQLNLRVGLIKDVQKHPDADALYVEDIDVGESSPRKVVSGLVNFVPIEQMQNRLVVVMCNLKPVKMRGIVSSGMVMCASTAEKVEPIRPPKNAEPGDLLTWTGLPMDNYPKPEEVLNPKKKIWERIAVDLKIDADGNASWMGKPLQVPGKGFITADTLRDVAVK